jgi:glutamate dehydrogenase/leucine dehydrogenase
MRTSNIEDLSDFDDHRLVTFFQSKKNNLKGYIAIHRGNNKYPAFGATRLWNYPDLNSALIDALKLSKTMSRKAALAGLHCGGAKAVILSNGNVGNRKEFLKSYAEKVNYLGGHFITGADVGIESEDVKTMRRFSPYFVGVKVDPVRFTGLGILYSIQACLKTTFGSEKLEDRTFAIQGVGKIGSELLKLIYPSAKKIYITDIDKSTIKNVKRRFPAVIVTPPLEIYKKKVDIFSPCALGNCLNKKNVNQFNCRIIVGGANCQLESEEIALKLHEKGILYAPDYLVNAGGLISVYDEYEDNNVHIRRIIKRVRKIKNTMKNIILLSKEKDKPTCFIANEMAEKIIKKLN